MLRSGLRRWGCALLVAACARCAGPRVRGPRAPGELAARASAACEARAYEELFLLIDPSRRARVVSLMLYDVIGQRDLDPQGDRRHQTRINALLNRWGILDNFDLLTAQGHPEIIAVTQALEAYPDEMLAGVDQQALYAELLRDFAFALPVGTMTDLRVEGDRATCRIGRHEIPMVRIEGVWFLTVEP